MDFDGKAARFPSGWRFGTPHFEQSAESLCSNLPAEPVVFTRLLQPVIFEKTRRISRNFIRYLEELYFRLPNLDFHTTVSAAAEGLLMDVS